MHTWSVFISKLYPRFFCVALSPRGALGVSFQWKSFAYHFLKSRGPLFQIWIQGLEFPSFGFGEKA